MGFQLFQGYFFSKPSIAGRSCNKSPTKIQYFQLISELKKEDPSFVRLAEMIELDAVLSYRILRMASVRSHKKTVKSIQSVLAFMGLNQIERWLSTLILDSRPLITRLAAGYPSQHIALFVSPGSRLL